MTSAVELEMKRQHISFYGRQFLEHSVVAAGSLGVWQVGEGRTAGATPLAAAACEPCSAIGALCWPRSCARSGGVLREEALHPPPTRPAAHRHLVSRLLDRWRPGGGPGGQGWAAATCHQIPAGQRLEALTLEGKGLSPDSFSPPF